MSNEYLDAALQYIDAGLSVVILGKESKETVTVHTPNGLLDATRNPDVARAWWELTPKCNVGIVCGKPSGGVIVIDIDTKSVDGYGTMRDWELEHGDMPETVTCCTPTGGLHFYYRVDREVRPSINEELGVDIRGDGSFAVAPPSIHPDTKTRYEWEYAPDEHEIADADERVYEFIEYVRPEEKRQEPDGRRKKPKMPKGGKKVHEGEGRNNFLYEQGCSLRGSRDDADDHFVAAWLETLNAEYCKPPLDKNELEKIIRSVCKHPVGMSDEVRQEAARRGRPRKFEHNKVARKLIEERGACLIDGETPAIRDGGRYRVGWDAFDAAIIDMHDDCTVSNRKEVKAYIQAKAESRRQSSPYLVAFLNGVLDVRTMELREWRDDDVIANVIPHNWNPDAEGDLLDGVLYKMANGDMATYMNLSEFIGVCMVRSAKLCPFFPVLIGVGSNGKSTYIELLKDVVGDENISGLQPKEITSHFLGTHIVGKTANLGDDIASGYLDDRDCAIIKSVATGDLMFTDVKGGKGFHFQPYCTMVFSCNQFPRLADTSPGFMRRLFPVEFNAVFDRSDPGYDPMIGEKLREEEVLEHACAIGVEGLRRVIDQNGPTPNEMSESMKSEIAREGNTGLQWFNDDQITAEHLVGMTKEEAHREYVAWCERNGYSRTAMGSGTLSALIGTYFRLKCTKTDHREYANGRRTVRVYAPNVPTGAA